MGLGVVGGGVANALLNDAQSMALKVGCPVDLRRVLVRDPTRPRSVELPPAMLTTDAQEVLNDENVSIVVELLGGEEPAQSYICQALQSGRHVVTANKEVMAKYGPELMAEARRNEVCLRFEASVAGGIPIIAPLTRDLLANDITSIHAIINGTTNYILTRMAQDRVDFSEALEEAQARGYAESDPSSDVEGTDARLQAGYPSRSRLPHAHRHKKTSIARVSPASKPKTSDMRKSWATPSSCWPWPLVDGDSVQARVHPCFIAQDHILAKVDGAFNAVEVEGNLIDRVMFHGPGAGREPTTSAVIADLIDVARGICSGRPASEPTGVNRPLAVADMSSLVDRYYLRLWVADRPGVLAPDRPSVGGLGYQHRRSATEALGPRHPHRRNRHNHPSCP